jgi:hypothetical protein
MISSAVSSNVARMSRLNVGEREQKFALFASRGRSDCKRLQLRTQRYPPGSLIDKQREMLQHMCPDQQLRIAIRYPYFRVREGC